MGFWHTGYSEFHEPAGLDPKFKPQPKRFACVKCGKLYSSPDELLSHRFEVHRLHRPAMFVRGRELGKKRVRITQPLSAADVRIAHCARVSLNDIKVPILRLSHELANISSDVCRIVLSKDGVDEAFELDFRIASEEDLEGVEDQFKRLARGRSLTGSAIREFTDAASEFTTATGYYDGICAYLYGVLAKEQAGGSNLRYEVYKDKFNRAAEELAAYDRPLAQTIGSLIAFHFNHFRDSARLSPKSRVGQVASRYSDWIESPGRSGRYTTNANELEGLVTDWETEQILCWASRPLNAIAGEATIIDTLLESVSAEYDKAKLRILLGELHAQMRNVNPALMHAKVLRNVPPFQGWAEALIKRSQGG